MSSDGIKDAQTVAADGRVLRELIDGVPIHETAGIITRNGITTEVVRPDWDIGHLAIAQAILARLICSASALRRRKNGMKEAAGPVLAL